MIDFQNSSLYELIAFILDKHHVYTKEAMTRLDALMKKVILALGQNHPDLHQTGKLFEQLCADLKPHMFKEEQILFPYILELERASLEKRNVPFAPFGTVNNPIRMMMMEHDTAGELLRELRALSSDYTAPADACISYKTLYQALEEFEEDLHQHIHLENDILFPRTSELEASTRKRSEGTMTNSILSRASQRLARDHTELDGVLRKLQTALNSGDVYSSYSQLDLFWARLAVHIRAEHLHLLPIVLNNLSDSVTLTVEQVRATVAALRADHDFFMHELGRAIGILRDLCVTTERDTIPAGLTAVRDTILGVEKRLVTHNELEENQIYSWLTLVLNEEQQIQLETRINNELATRPARFAEKIWSKFS